MTHSLCSLDRLIQLLHQIQPLSHALEATLIRGFEKVIIKKGRTILSQGTNCNHLWYLADGLVRSYLQLNSDDEETTTRIMLPEHIVLSIFSYYENQPSLENIEAIKDSCLFKMSKQTLENIYKEFPEFNLHGRVLTEQYLLQADRREAMLRITNARDRYKEFMTRYGHYLEFIPARYAASFTNLSRATFTNIKNNKYMGKGEL